MTLADPITAPPAGPAKARDPIIEVDPGTVVATSGCRTHHCSAAATIGTP